jgi:hypothetical protein
MKLKINVELPLLEEEEIISLIRLLTNNKQNSSITNQIINEYVGHLNNRYFNVDVFNVMSYAKALYDLSDIIPISAVNRDLSIERKDKLYNEITKNKIKNILNENRYNLGDSSNKTQNLLNTLSYAMKLTQFDIKKNVNETLNNMLELKDYSNIQKYIEQITYFGKRYFNKDLESVCFNNINFQNSLKQKDVLMNLLPELGRVFYKKIKNYISYDLNEFNKEDISILYKNIMNKTTNRYLLNSQIFSDGFKKYINTFEDLNIIKISTPIAILLENKKAGFLPDDIYKIHVNKYLNELNKISVESKINTLLNSYKKRPKIRLTLDEVTCFEIFNYVATEITAKPKMQVELFSHFNLLFEVLNNKTETGSMYISDLLSSKKMNFKKYQKIRPILEKIQFESILTKKDNNLRILKKI